MALLPSRNEADFILQHDLEMILQYFQFWCAQNERSFGEMQCFVEPCLHQFYTMPFSRLRSDGWTQVLPKSYSQTIEQSGQKFQLEMHFPFFEVIINPDNFEESLCVDLAQEEWLALFRYNFSSAARTVNKLAPRRAGPLKVGQAQLHVSGARQVNAAPRAPKN